MHQGTRHDSFLSVEDVEMFGKAVQDLLLANGYGQWHIGSEMEAKGGHISACSDVIC